MSGRRRDSAAGRIPCPAVLVTVSVLAGSGWTSGVAAAGAQELPHPREMGLPEVDVYRPDPGEHRIELANGIVAYVVEDHTVALVTLSALVGAGWARGPAGAAAAVERALRRGPADQTPGLFGDRLRAMAAELRTSLTPERLEMTLDVPAEDARSAIDLMARTLRDPVIEAVEGREGSGAARPGGGAYEGSLASATGLFRRLLYGDHPYGPAHRDGDGAPDQAAVRSFHRARVVPGNTVVAVAGDFDAGEMRELVRTHFGSWQGGAPSAPARAPEADPPRARTVQLYPVDGLQGWIVLGHELPPVPESDRAALEVMNYILGGGHFDTRLFRETRDRRGLTNDDSGYLESYVRGPGTYTFRTYGRPEAVKLLIEITMREIERIRSEPVTEEELFVARGALADGAFADRYADGWASARSLAVEARERGDHGASASYGERIRSVTADDVLEAARTYLHPERMTIVVLGPIDEIRAAPPMEGERALEAWGEVVEHGPGPGGR